VQQFLDPGVPEVGHDLAAEGDVGAGLSKLGLLVEGHAAADYAHGHPSRPAVAPDAAEDGQRSGGVFAGQDDEVRVVGMDMVESGIRAGEDTIHVGSPQDRAAQLRDRLGGRHDQDPRHSAPLEVGECTTPRREQPRRVYAAVMDTIEIPTEQGAVSASVHGEGKTVLALGHGAGGDRRTALLVRLANTLAEGGRRVVLHNFPYTEARRRVPDKPAVLEATIVAVAAHAREALGASRLVLGGKSMGGRIASQAVAQGLGAEGLVFLGYPLHPPGRVDTLRDKHLPSITAPMLFVQGTRDAFARTDLLATVLRGLGDRATLHSIEGGDHSFAVPRRTGRAPAQIEAEVASAIVSWLTARGL
jgi:predicted alpha/beta-hydrolase family hydrolase